MCVFTCLFSSAPLRLLVENNSMQRLSHQPFKIRPWSCGPFLWSILPFFFALFLSLSLLSIPPPPLYSLNNLSRCCISYTVVFKCNDMIIFLIMGSLEMCFNLFLLSYHPFIFFVGAPYKQRAAWHSSFVKCTAHLCSSICVCVCV